MTSLDVSSFDTSSVTDMSFMFGYCSSLTTLNVSSFDTSKVTSKNTIFQNCGTEETPLVITVGSGWNLGTTSNLLGGKNLEFIQAQ